jgi:hypothetical protein
MTRDTQIAPTTGQRHPPIHNALRGETQDLWDPPTACDAR